MAAPTHRLPQFLLTAVLLGGLGSASAQPFLYALNEGGTLTVNGTVLNSLSGGSGDQRWWELFVLGSDRYALRIDGRVSKNGANLMNLPFDEIDLGAWVGLAVTDTNVWALRTDGLLNRDAASAIDYVESDFFFVELVTDGTDTYALRSDGAIFRNTVAEPLFAFMGGPGLGGAAEGAAPDTVWVDLALSPIDGSPHALRRDGKLVQGVLTEGEIPNGIVVANLPFDVEVLTPAASYTDVTFADDGRWFAVRANGDIFDQDNQVDPLLELPGNPNTNEGQTYLEMVGFGKGLLVVRWDGRLYDGSNTGALLDLKGSRYRNIALANDPPDLENFKNAKPQLTRYLAQAVTGTPVAFPVDATDTDKESADLIVTIDPEDLPTGALWDELARTITWADPGPKGTYKIPVVVDDGIAKPVKKKVSIKVRDPDANLDKNRKPHATKIKSARGLVGRLVSLPILASDRDEDVLTITANETKEPFVTQGASFDAKTNTFSWTPQLGDIGTYTLRFTVEDGTAKRVLKVKLKVLSSLLSL